MKLSKKDYKNLKIFGKNVQKLRTTENLTIKQLSEKTQIREHYLKKIEKGTAIGVSTKHLFKLAIALNVSPSELVKNL